MIMHYTEPLLLVKKESLHFRYVHRVHMGVYIDAFFSQMACVTYTELIL